MRVSCVSVAALLGLLDASVVFGWSSSNRMNRGTATRLFSSTSNNNIVLRPSEDPEAFDSFRIGTARIHRYIRDMSSSIEDDSGEYVMWYHGREEKFDEAGELPPLSTGRIGRATSRNGLHWERCQGSASEDVGGVSLGPNKESWWGFDTAHVGLGQVMLPMSTPAVISEGGVYLMYYMGGSFEETPLQAYLDPEHDIPQDATIQGMNMRIGVALSQDGKAWGRIEGDFPCGAVMVPYDTSNPNMGSITNMRDDDDSILTIEEELYCAWPDVVMNSLSDEQKRKVGVKGSKPNFFMYYSSMSKDSRQKNIACAVSEDGFRWYKRGVCLRPSSGDDNDLDNGGCARCNVLKNASYDKETRVWRDEIGWTMYYEGISKEDNKHRIMVATSLDGRVWEKMGLILNVGDNDDAWDCDGVGSPHVIRMDDGSTRMYYTGQGKDGSTAIGVAKCENHLDVANGEGWAREQAEFTFS